MASCRSGYTRVGAEQLSCHAGTVSGSFSCEPNDCTTPAVVAASACSVVALAHGSTCTPSCETGYTASGEDLSCSAGVISGSFVCEPDGCVMPSVPKERLPCYSYHAEWMTRFSFRLQINRKPEVGRDRMRDRQTIFTSVRTTIFLCALSAPRQNVEPRW